MDGRYVPPSLMEIQTLELTGTNGLSASFVKYGRVCTFFVNSEVTAAITAWQGDLFTVPEAFRPMGNCFCQNCLSAGKVSYLYMTPNGAIRSGGNEAVGDHMQCFITYITAV